MIRLNRELKNRESEGNPIKVVVVGLGFMGKSLFVQLCGLKGFKPVMIISRRRESCEEALKSAGISADKSLWVTDAKEAEKAIAKGLIPYGTDIKLASQVKIADCVVDATGDPVDGAELAEDTIKAGIHMVSLNVEADMCVGPYLMELADERNVVYTGTAGDEPGSAVELWEFANLLGLEVLAIGKGKNNPIDYGATPDSVKEQAKKSGLAPKMLCSFIDGTKTMGELCLMANATGMVPDVVGGHGPKATADELATTFRLKEDGGILEKYGIVEYVRGVAPGVFVIVTHDKEIIKEELTFLKMGEGPNYALYRPYHLTSIETPISIARAVIDGVATIKPNGKKPVAAVPAVAKRDLLKDETFDGIGGDMVLGSLMSWEDFIHNSCMPISLLERGVKVKQDISKGAVITWSDVEIVEETPLLRMYLTMLSRLGGR
ncbi:MAG: NAD(P)-dependent oxidoreductase [Tissierellia bacterium]|nr:NAD(P)-dependent oxidoreductase [Tissierellia bacterium]